MGFRDVGGIGIFGVFKVFRIVGIFRIFRIVGIVGMFGILTVHPSGPHSQGHQPVQPCPQAQCPSPPQYQLSSIPPSSSPKATQSLYPFLFELKKIVEVGVGTGTGIEAGMVMAIWRGWHWRGLRSLLGRVCSP
jgi:hypothetical protein